MRRSVVERFLVFAVIVLACLVGGCGSGSDGSSSSGVVVDPVGSWSGTTSDGLPFSFVVTPDGISSVSLSWELRGARCGYRGEATSSGTPIALEGNTFSVDSLSLGQGVQLNATGEFTSSTAASGTFQLSDTECVGTVAGTWTASKT